MRIAVVSSLFPTSTDPHWGLPIYRTILELNKRSDLAVFVPSAVYPGLRWLQPTSYVYRRPVNDVRVDGVAVQVLEYRALPGLTRLFNGSRVSNALMEPVRAFRPDLILAYWLYPEGYGAYRVARKLGLPFVVSVRGSDLLHLPDPFMRRMVRSELSDASAVLAVSDRMKARISELGGKDDRVQVLLNGCDRTDFDFADRAEARRALGLDQQSELILFVGRLMAVKGLPYLVRAAIQLAASRPKLQLVIVGEGSEQAALEEIVAASGSRLNVRFVKPVPPREVAEWMAASNVLCLPSLNEGCPNVVIEAICCGRPVVATDVGANPDLVNQGNGVLVEPRDPEQLAAALDQVLSREWDSTSISRTFQRGWDTVAEETLSVCRNVVEARRSHSV